jgi:hypothetical protein
MGAVKDIVAERDAGAVRCGLSGMASPSVAEIAREFGLCDDAALYEEIGEIDARRLMRVVLHRDMAYGAEIMSEARATGLADAFVALFDPGTRYFTNGTWYVPSVIAADGSGHGPEWRSATDATFDTGVIAIGSARSGCFWVEDED